MMIWLYINAVLEHTEFKLKMTTKFKKVVQAFCQKKGLEKKLIRFMFDGQRIEDLDTPKSVSHRRSIIHPSKQDAA